LAISIVSLILVNLLPLAGVLFLGWQLFSVMFLYWSESAIIGFFNIFKMMQAEGQTRVNIELNDKPIERWSRPGVIGFFILHYSIFMVVHLMFIFALFKPARINPQQIALVFVFLFVSHGLSYLYNFIGKKEYQRISLSQLFVQPYGRIVLMHLTILGGGFAVKSLGEPLIALVIMIIIKIIIDLYAHLKEHKTGTVPAEAIKGAP
jgi:hypothetical protein